MSLWKQTAELLAKRDLCVRNFGIIIAQIKKKMRRDHDDDDELYDEEDAEDDYNNKDPSSSSWVSFFQWFLSGCLLLKERVELTPVCSFPGNASSSR